MGQKYTYNITDFLNNKVNISKLTREIQSASITIAIDYINTNESICDMWFKATIDSTAELSTLATIVANHDGEPLPKEEAPTMADGRPLVRADTRPLGTQTYFTCCGDDSTSIGGGVCLRWDFSNDDDEYDGPEVPSGYKAKELLLSFQCPVYLKDGAIYFFDAPWGQVMHLDIIVPSGGYYPNPAGAIPAAALGLPGNEMYAQASGNVVYQSYVHKHYVYGDCPMGDELNAEGCSVDALPVGWYLRGLIMTPNSDTISKGYSSMEMYRCHSTLLPGQTIENIH